MKIRISCPARDLHGDSEALWDLNKKVSVDGVEMAYFGFRATYMDLNSGMRGSCDNARGAPPSPSTARRECERSRFACALTRLGRTSKT